MCCWIEDIGRAVDGFFPKSRPKNFLQLYSTSVADC